MRLISRQKGTKMVKAKSNGDCISRQAALDIINAELNGWLTDDERLHLEGVGTGIECLPTIDAVPVVRCKDCKYYREGVMLPPQKFCFRLKDRNGEEIGYNFADDDFCSHGERSEE